MYQSIIYKEWIKTAKLILLALVVFAATVGYAFISITQALRVEGTVNVWEAVIMNDIPLLTSIKWIPVLTAILLALSQFIPEMQFKRLKLTLHLPLSEKAIVSTMLLYGVAILLVVSLFFYLILLIGLRLWFASEIVEFSFYASLPWFLAGFTAYALTSWICLEPVWQQRIVAILLTVSVLSLYFIGAKSGSYNTFNLYLIGFSIVSLLFPFYSVARFKEGAQ